MAFSVMKIIIYVLITRLNIDISRAVGGKCSRRDVYAHLDNAFLD